jgi:hypothetical protein
MLSIVHRILCRQRDDRMARYMNRWVRFAGTSILGVLLCASVSATAHVDGKGRKYWDNRTMLVCEITKIDVSGSPAIFHFRVLETVYTDLPVKTEISAEYPQFDSTLESADKFTKGDVVVAVLVMSDKKLCVDWNGNGFMPMQNGMSKVDGLDDKKLLDAITKSSSFRHSVGDD